MLQCLSDSQYFTVRTRCKYQLLRRLSVQALTFISAISDNGRATTTTLHTDIHTTLHCYKPENTTSCSITTTSLLLLSYYMLGRVSKDKLRMIEGNLFEGHKALLLPNLQHQRSSGNVATNEYYSHI